MLRFRNMLINLGRIYYMVYRHGTCYLFKDIERKTKKDIQLGILVKNSPFQIEVRMDMIVINFKLSSTPHQQVLSVSENSEKNHCCRQVF